MGMDNNQESYVHEAVVALSGFDAELFLPVVLVVSTLNILTFQHSIPFLPFIL